MRDELLGYYERELIFLRRMGADFAKKYPKIAARLLLDEEKIEDPHVERMVESFALLAGRVSLKRITRNYRKFSQCSLSALSFADSFDGDCSIFLRFAER
jgi:type VI secretion system protein ImpG